MRRLFCWLSLLVCLALAACGSPGPRGGSTITQGPRAVSGQANEVVMLALFGKTTGISLMRLAVVLGPFINLLAPIAFYMLAAFLFGRAAGVAGLCLMLFGKEGGLPFWTCAYCPWLLAPMYSAGLLFLCIYAYMKALESKGSGYFCLTGLLLGTAFMSHTAPAVIGGGTLLLLTLSEMLRLRRTPFGKKAVLRAALMFGLVLGIAFLVSLPYSGPILWKYQFHVLNPWPSLYASQNVELHNLPKEFYQSLNLRNTVALIGFLFLLKRRGNT